MALFYKYYFLDPEGKECIFYAQSKKEAQKLYIEWYEDLDPDAAPIPEPKLIRRERW